MPEATPPEALKSSVSSGRARKPSFFSSCSIRKSQAAELYSVDAIPALFIIDKRGKIIYGDASLDASVEFVLAQKLGLIDEAAAGA